MKNIITSIIILIFNQVDFAQHLPDTFQIISTEKGIKQLLYSGKLPTNDSLLNSEDFSDKLITAITRKYVLDSTFHLLDSGTVINNNNSLAGWK